MLLFKLFKAYGIEIVASEGSINAFGKRHTMSFIIGCQKYHAPGDGYSRDRKKQHRVVMRDLEFILNLNFADQLSFSDPGFARVKIKRISEYWRLANEIGKTRASTGTMLLKSHGMDIDKARIRLLLREPHAQIICTPAVDTKNRLLRLLFFAERADRPEHVQFAFHRDHTTGIARMFELLFELDQNVIKYQVRSGGNESTAERARRPLKSLIARLDVTFEPYRHRNAKQYPLEKIISRLSKDSIIRKSGGMFCKSHSENHKVSHHG
jgi:hypothetical protein